MTNTPNTIDNTGLDEIFSGHKVITTTNTTTSQATTYTDLVGLKHRVYPGTYYFEGWLNGSAASSGGIQLKFAGAGTTATVTTTNITTWDYNGTTLNAVTNQTTFTTNLLANAAAITDILIKGWFNVTEPGDIQLQVTQNTSNATSTIINVGSYLNFTRVT